MRIRTSRVVPALALLLTAAMCCGEARADAETDRLREALRNAITQTRTLEDARAALQAKLADAEKDRAALKAQVDAARAQTRQLEKEQREAVEQFNQRLTERDETLDKWKSAYEEAANVARTKDAERAKFEGEATAYKASTKNCLDKNVQLMKVGRELLHRYEAVNFGDMLVAREPLLGEQRIRIQNLLQDYNDKLLDQKATP
jgi:chromosome segregation ATPase